MQRCIRSIAIHNLRNQEGRAQFPIPAKAGSTFAPILWNGTWYVLTNSTKIDDVLAAVEQLNGFVSIEIDLVHQAGQHEPYLGNIDLTWPATKPDISIVYNGPNLAEPFMGAIIDEVKDFAASLTAEATS